MQHVHRLAGIAAIALTAAALSACYPPPQPNVAAAPSTLPPQTPPIYLPPTATTPAYPRAATITPPPAPPQYGPTTPPTAAPSGAGTTSPIVAPFAPPPPQVEIPPSSLSPGMAWQPGHWSWSWIEGRYAWTPGNYVPRPAPTANWVPGYWQQGPTGWIWVEGRWA